MNWILTENNLKQFDAAYNIVLLPFIEKYAFFFFYFFFFTKLHLHLLKQTTKFEMQLAKDENLTRHLMSAFLRITVLQVGTKTGWRPSLMQLPMVIRCGHEFHVTKLINVLPAPVLKRNSFTDLILSFPLFTSKDLMPTSKEAKKSSCKVCRRFGPVPQETWLQKRKEESWNCLTSP